MTKAIPDGFHTITPHIVVSDAAKAIEFYKKALGAQENERFMTPTSGRRFDIRSAISVAGVMG